MSGNVLLCFNFLKWHVDILVAFNNLCSVLYYRIYMTYFEHSLMSYAFAVYDLLPQWFHACARHRGGSSLITHV